MNNMPNLRFPGFTDDWEQHKLGEIAPLRGGYAFQSANYCDNGVPIVRISNILADGTVGGSFAKYHRLPNDGQFSIHDGDAVLAMSGATTGKVAILKAKKGDTYYQNQRVGYFVNTGKVDYSFVSTIVRSELFINQLKNVLVTGAQPNVSPYEVGNFMFSFPKNIKEQNRIGSLFQDIDDLITLYQHKLDGIKLLKQSLLQKMFPKDGEDTPEIRFPGYTDDWEQRKLGKIGTTYTGLSGKCKNDFGHGKAKFVTYMNVYQNPVAKFDQTECVEIDHKQSEIKYGDVFFTTSSETPDEVGMSSIWLGDAENLYLNSFCFGYRPEISIDPYYLAFLLRSPSIRAKFIFLAQGISRYNISKNKVMEITIPLPEIPEQQQIGTFFKNLDNLVTLHQRKLNNLKQLKQALLQQMFI